MKVVRDYLRCLSRWPGMVVTLAGLTALSVAGALLGGMGLGLLIPIMESLQKPGAAADVRIGGAGLLKPLLSLAGLEPTLPVFLAASMTVFALYSFVAYHRDMALGRADFRLFRDMQVQAFRQLTEFDLGFFHRSRAGDLVGTLTSEAARASHSLHTAMTMLSSLCLALVYAAVQVRISWRMTAVTLATLAPLAYFLRPRQSYQWGLEQSQKTRDIQSLIVETIGGIREVKVLGLDPLVQGRVEGLSRRLYDVNMGLVRAALKSMFLFQCAVSIVIVGLLYAGSRWAGLSLPALIVYILALQRMAPQVQSFVEQRHWWLGAIPALERVDALLEETSKARAAVVSGPRRFGGLVKGLSLKDVSFRYPGRETDGVTGLSLDLARGEMVAVVGSSGAGKSTLLDLLARFYDPSQGSIEADGRDLRELDLDSWRAALGLVSQDTFLFNDTLENNIRFGRRDATREEVEEAAKRAHIHDFISSLREGYGMGVEDRGVTLSGGQRQRVALARVFLRKPQLLLLDEATSDLDAESEAEIQKVIAELRGKTTMVMVAHRLSTVALADRVVVLEGGRIVEEGPPAELLGKGGRFAALHAFQRGA